MSHTGLHLLILDYANNFQLALTSLEAQLEKCRLNADLLATKTFQNQDDKTMVQVNMEDLIHEFNIMSLAVKDLNNTNADFLSRCFPSIWAGSQV